jgi:cobalt-zinc-cadmium efflux system outer membrane protein
MSLRRVALAAIVACAIPSLSRAQTGPPPLDPADLVERAVQRNREFLALQQRIAETAGLLRQAGVRPAPALEIEQSTGRPLGSPGERTFSIGYFHTIETSGKRDKRVAVARASADAVEADLADRRRLLALDVKVRYAQALRERQKLETIRQLSETNREYYGVTEVRVRAGDAAPLEGQLFLTELRRVEAQEAVLAGSADRAMFELRKVVGAPAAEPLALAPWTPPAELDAGLVQLQARALRERPDLRVLELLEAQSAAEEALAHAEGRPDLTASARYAREHTGFSQLGYDGAGQLVPLRARDNILTVGLSVLLFQPKRSQGAIAAAEARSEGARLRREHVASVARLEVEAAYRRWQAARAAVEILDRGVIGQSENNLALLQQAYVLGQLRVLDVLNEQRRVIETRLAYLDAQAELFEAFAELEASVGGSLQ